MVVELFKTTQIEPPSLLDVLAYTNSERTAYLDDELARRQQVAEVRQAATGWEGKVMEYCRTRGIRFSTLKATEQARAEPWFSTLTEPQQLHVAIAQTEHGPLLAADISQSIGSFSRLVLPVDGKLRSIQTIMPGNEWYIAAPGFHRPLLGLEGLILQGFPVHLMDEALQHLSPEARMEFTDRFFMDLAGNAMSGSVLYSLMSSTLLTAPWRDVDLARERGLLARVMGTLSGRGQR